MSVQTSKCLPWPFSSASPQLSEVTVKWNMEAACYCFIISLPGALTQLFVQILQSAVESLIPAHINKDNILQTEYNGRNVTSNNDLSLWP